MTRNLPIRRFGNVERRTFAKIEEVQPMPYLIEIQRDSYKSFIEEGISEVFEDYSPITDYSDRFELYPSTTKRNVATATPRTPFS